MTIEKLTEEERARILDSTPIAFPGAHYVGKMLRIIDEQAAELATESRVRLSRARLRLMNELDTTRAQLAEARARTESTYRELTLALATGRHLRSQLAEARAEINHWAAEASAFDGQLTEARALLEGLRRELEDRGGDLSRKTWNRLDVYCDGVLTANPESPRDGWDASVRVYEKMVVPESPRAAAERAVLDAAEAFAFSWELTGAEPYEELPEERALFHAVLALRAVKP